MHAVLAGHRRLRPPPALPVQPSSIARRRLGCARSWRFVNACLALGKSFGPRKATLRRLRRPGLTHPWRNCGDSPTSSLAILGKSFGPQKATLFVGCADRASPIPGATAGLRQPPALPVQPSSIARRRSGCARSWRFANACLALGKSFGPQKATLRRLRRPGLTHPWRNRGASLTPSLASPAVEHSSASLGLRTKLALRKRLPRPWQVVRPSKLRFVGCADWATCPRLVCAGHPWRNCEASPTSSLAIRGKSFGPQKATLRRLRRPGLTHPWRNREASLTSSLASPAVEHSSASLGLRTKLALRKRLPRPWQVVRPSKLRFVGCADRATCPRLVCVCHPWRNCEASPTSSLAIRGKSFGPQKATLFVGCADRASPIHGATSRVSPIPCLDGPATEHSSVALGLRTKLALRNRLPSPMSSR